MKSNQEKVREFHHVFEQPRAERPGLGEGFPLELRKHLIEEEAGELVRALEAGDVVGAIDGMCDLLYVVYGTAVAMRIDIDPYFDEVHRSNMAKLGPDGRPIFRKDIPKRVMKPEGWQPPKLREMWEASQVDPSRCTCGGYNAGDPSRDIEKTWHYTGCALAPVEPTSNECAQCKYSTQAVCEECGRVLV